MRATILYGFLIGTVISFLLLFGPLNLPDWIMVVNMPSITLVALIFLLLGQVDGGFGAGILPLYLGVWLQTVVVSILVCFAFYWRQLSKIEQMN